MIKDFFDSAWNKLISSLFLLAAILQIVAFAFPERQDSIRLASILGLIGFGSYISLFFVNKFYQQQQAHVIEKIVEARLNKLEDSPLNKKHTETNDIAALAYKYFAGRYGMGNRSIEVQWAIRDDGSASLVRMIDLEAYSQVTTLETYLAIPEKSTSGSIRDIGLEDIESEPPFREVKATKVEQHSNRLSVSLSIDPPLRKGDLLKYKMQENLAKKLYSIELTAEQQKLREKQYDYSGWNINLPTKKIVLKVFIPTKAKPKEFWAEVRYASTAGFPANRIQLEETERLPKPSFSFEGELFVLKLEVDYPMLGLIYLLAWEPVTKENLSSSSESLNSTDPKQQFLISIREILIEKFDEGELQTLSGDLRVDYDNLPGSGKANKARELIRFLERRNQIRELLRIGKQHRSDISWPEQPD